MSSRSSDFRSSASDSGVFIFSQLVFEALNVELVDLNTWEVCTVEWPSGQVDLVLDGGGYKITPNYQNPFFF